MKAFSQEDIKAFAVARLIQEIEQLEEMLRSAPHDDAGIATQAVRIVLAEKTAELERLEA